MLYFLVVAKLVPRVRTSSSALVSIAPITVLFVRRFSTLPRVVCFESVSKPAC